MWFEVGKSGNRRSDEVDGFVGLANASTVAAGNAWTWEHKNIIYCIILVRSTTALVEYYYELARLENTLVYFLVLCSIYVCIKICTAAANIYTSH